MALALSTSHICLSSCEMVCHALLAIFYICDNLIFYVKAFDNAYDADKF